MTEQTVWLVDSSIYVFRAWFVRQAPNLPEQTVRPPHAALGFLRFVYHLLQTEQPQHIGFAFDVSQQRSARREIFPAYKANRVSAPDGLRAQFQLCRDFLDALGLVQTASHHHEADDVIGTWVQQQRANGKACMIISGDKDLAQLVGEHDRWWDYGSRKPLNDGGVKKAFGVWPAQLPDQLAIAGDKADNIPGIPGVGMATAAKLLKHFHTLDGLFAHIPDIGKLQIHGATRVQALVAEYQASVRRARQLTGIDCSVPDVPHDLQRRPKDGARLRELCGVLGLSEQQLGLWLQV